MQENCSKIQQNILFASVYKSIIKSQNICYFLITKKEIKQLKTNRQNKLQFPKKMTATIWSTIRANKSNPLERKWLVFTRSVKWEKAHWLSKKQKNSNFYDWIIWISGLSCRVNRGRRRRSLKLKVLHNARSSKPRISHFNSPIWRRMQNTAFCLSDFDSKTVIKNSLSSKNCLFILISLFSSISIWISHHNKHETMRSQRE